MKYSDCQMITPRQQRIRELKIELHELESQEVADIFKNTPNSVQAQCLALVNAKQTLQAIIHYRNVTGCTLVQAKEAIDLMSPTGNPQ